jgi:hypothetical protein
MTFQEFIDMLRAIEADKPFTVGFQLQHSSEGGVTLQKLHGWHGAGRLADFMEKVAAAEPPDYGVKA